MLALTIVSFAAGVLTVLAPCVLPLLPVIVGGTAARTAGESAGSDRTWLRPLVIAASLAVSVVAFTLLLKASSALLGIPAWVWQSISACDRRTKAEIDCHTHAGSEERGMRP